MRVIARILLVVYGVLLIAGGVMGYASKGSMASLIAGSVSGVLAILAFGLSLGRPRTGLALGLIVAIALTVERGMNWLKGGAFFPSGAVAILSVLMAVLIATALLQRGGRRSARRVAKE